MFSSLVRKLQSEKSGRRHRSTTSRPILEALEDRWLPSTFNWFQAVDGDFNDPSRWQDQNGNPGVPGPSDDANIPGGITVTSSANNTVNSLTSTARLVLAGGTFAMNNLIHDSALVGGGVAVEAGATLQVNGGTTVIINSDITGTLDAEPGGTLPFLLGTNTFEAGSTMTGTGQYLVEGNVFGGPEVTLNADITAPANFILRNGVLDGGGTLTIPTGTVFNWVQGGAGGAVMAGTGETDVQDGATLNIGGLGTTLDRRTLNNAGTVNWNDTGNFGLNDGAVFNNSGTFNVQNDAAVGFGGTFNNSGVVNKSSPVGTGTTFFDSVFDNTGTVNITSGTLDLHRGGTAAGSFNTADAGQLVLSNNIYTLNPGASLGGTGLYALAGADLVDNAQVSVSNFSQSSTLDGSGVFTITGTDTWSSGTMTGTGVTNIAAGATVNLTSDGTKTVDSRTLNNAGTINWIDTGNLSLTSGSVFNNNSTFNIQNDAAVGFGGTFNNAGVLNKSSPVGTGTTFVDSVFNSTGTVNIASGTLTLNRGGTAAGAFNIAGGGLLLFVGNNYTLNAGTSFTGDGLCVAGANVAVLGDLMGGNLALDFGFLTGTGSVTFTGGTFDWTGGIIANSNGTFTFAPDDKLLIQGNNYRSLNGGTLNLAGLTTWSDNGSLGLNGATINNQAGATFLIENDQVLSGLGTFSNAGTLIKAAGIGTTAVTSAIAFANNGGLVSLQNGTLRIDNFVQNAGTTDIGAGASLASAGTIFILGGILSGSGTVGTGTLPANLVNSGTISPGGDGSAGILTIVGNYTQTVTGVLNIDIGGYSPGNDYDQLIVTGAVNLAGTLNINLIKGFTPQSGDSFQALLFGSVNGDFTAENLGPFAAAYSNNSLNVVAN